MYKKNQKRIFEVVILENIIMYTTSTMWRNYE